MKDMLILSIFMQNVVKYSPLLRFSVVFYLLIKINLFFI
ncbi:hypothetical protein J694_1065 [Acinetobacter sp. 1281984]|nr:hypothetical protein J627_0176 [Acinetobacter sp. 1245593]EXR30283.1 hypothetical protein J694_1065 [Acinetobacter sp. 1281984]